MCSHIHVLQCFCHFGQIVNTLGRAGMMCIMSFFWQASVEPRLRPRTTVKTGAAEEVTLTTSAFFYNTLQTEKKLKLLKNHRVKNHVFPYPVLSLHFRFCQHVNLKSKHKVKPKTMRNFILGYFDRSFLMSTLPPK